MIAAIQLPQVVVATLENKVEYTFVEDAALIHVGGGCSATAHF